MAIVGTNSLSKRRRRSSARMSSRPSTAIPKLLPLHLLAALLEDNEGIVPPVLEKIGIGPQAVLSEVYRSNREAAEGLGRQRAAGDALERSQPAARAGFQRSRQFQGRVRFDRAPAAGGYAA